MNIQEHYHQAQNAYNKRDYNKTIQLCNQILQSHPKHFESWNLLGNTFFYLQELNSAKEFFLTAINLKPDYFDAYYMLGNVLFQANEFHDAIAIWKESIKIKPNFALSYANIAIAYLSLNDIDNTLEYSHQALDYDKNCIDALRCLARVYQKSFDLVNAKKYLEQIIDLDNTQIDAKFDLAYVYLSKEEYKQGFQLFESRMQMPQHKHMYDYLPFKKWNQQSLTNKHLLIYHEQGFGDSLQFSRFFNQLKCKKITIGIQNSLNKLFSYNFKHINFVGEIKSNDTYDLVTPLMSIPFQLQLNNITNHPYLSVAKKDLEAFKTNKLNNNLLNIGLVWTGSQTSSLNKKRSIKLSFLSPLLKLKNTQFHSLQIENNEGINNYDINNLGKDFKNFYDTAVAIKSMDLVISVDTAVAHLSGALGQKTFVIYEYNTIDFRWIAKNRESIWYESIKIYKQEELDIIRQNIETLLKEKNDL